MQNLEKKNFYENRKTVLRFRYEFGKGRSLLNAVDDCSTMDVPFGVFSPFGLFGPFGVFGPFGLFGPFGPVRSIPSLESIQTTNAITE